MIILVFTTMSSDITCIALHCFIVRHTCLCCYIAVRDTLHTCSVLTLGLQITTPTVWNNFALNTLNIIFKDTSKTGILIMRLHETIRHIFIHDPTSY